MRKEVLDSAARQRMFLSPDALELILCNNDPIDFAATVLNSLSKNAVFITADDVRNFLTGESTVMKSPKPIVPKNKRQSDISVIPETDITGESTCEGKIDDFAKYFKYRYFTLRKLLRERRDFAWAGLGILDALNLDREVKIVGIVSDIMLTKNGHRIMTIEDDTASCKLLIMKDSPMINEIIVSDEVVGVVGKPSNKKDMIIASEIFRPEIQVNSWKRSDSVGSIAFLSDVHVGSKTFMKKNWDRMVKWMKQNAYDNDIDYLVFPGDVVDGIGIFPGQIEELDVLDIFDQYELFAEYLKDLPDHVKMVVHPGNHDAVRPAEPQPALSSIYTKTFDSNVMMVGNPVSLNVEGRTVLTYHGRSIDDWVSGVQQLSYDDPVRIMQEMLSRRHLAPIYGQKTALAPEKRDYMVIERVPDIFVTGHVHGAGYVEYRGTKMINASAWQDQTEYQKSHNFNPKPAVMPIVHLGTGRTSMQDFN
jgi:Archaeal DNA polymerase II, small subunit/DNA polymerase delta, subunit B